MITCRCGGLAALLGVVALIQALSQNAHQPWLYVGGYGAYRNNLQSADFQSLPNAFRCGPNYTTGTGGIGSAGVLATYPFARPLVAELRLGYAPLSGRLFTSEVIGNTAEIGGSNATVPVQAMHELFTTMPAIVLEPTVGAVLFHRIRVGWGISFSYVLSHTFSQVETLTEPSYVFYLPDSSRQRNRTSGTIGNVYPLQLHMSFSIGVDFPLTSELSLTPELRYYLPLTQISRDVEWKIAPVSIGVSGRYALYPPPPPQYHFDTIYVRDTSIQTIIGLEREWIELISRTEATTQREEYQEQQKHLFITTTISEHYQRTVPRAARLQLAVTARALNFDGSPLDSLSKVVIEETEVEESFPLLPYVFFAEGSSMLELTRMQLLQIADTSTFDESRLPASTLDIYHNLLNIVGKRMRRFPMAKLTMVGTNSNIGTEAGNLELSQARAIAVRDYLVRVWGIDPARITVRTRNLPAYPSNPATPDGQEENRRVELIASDPQILSPVTISSVTVSSNPPIVELVPTVESEVGLAEWSATIEQDGKIIRRVRGTDALPEPYRWDVTTSPYPRLDEPVTIRYAARDRTGQQIDTSFQVNVKQLTVRQKRYEQRDDKRIDRFSLIVFEFNKAELTPAHRQLLQEVRARIQPQSTVTIAGYADRSGDSDYNRELARRRCVEVQRVLGIPDGSVSLLPKGSDELLYDNSTPEGRSYCRTVQVIIETPLKNGQAK